MCLFTSLSAQRFSATKTQQPKLAIAISVILNYFFITAADGASSITNGGPAPASSTQRISVSKLQQPTLAIAAISVILNSFFLDADASTSTTCAPAPTSSLVVNVKSTGATGDGVTDDTTAIQTAINQVAGSGGTVLVPDGVYMIDALTSLSLQSNMTLSLTSGAILQAIPNNQDVFRVILIENVSNVNLIGGTVQGERDQHLVATGDGEGEGVDIEASNAVTVQGVISENNWGDGFYIGTNSANVTFCSVTANNNRRHGTAITSVNGAVLKNSVFMGSNGTANSAGIDIEPNSGETVNNVQLLNSEFQNNWASGIQASFPSLADAANSFITNLLIQGNTVNNNGVIGTYSAAISLSSQKDVQVLNNIVSNNVQDGILIYNNSTKNNIMGNTVTGSGYNNPLSDQSAGYGILIQNGSTLNTITHNIVNNNESGDIVDQVGGNRINTNTDN